MNKQEIEDLFARKFSIATISNEPSNKLRARHHRGPGAPKFFDVECSTIDANGVLHVRTKQVAKIGNTWFPLDRDVVDSEDEPRKIDPQTGVVTDTSE